jgi:hypothetical protein
MQMLEPKPRILIFNVEENRGTSSYKAVNWGLDGNYMGFVHYSVTFRFRFV